MGMDVYGKNPRSEVGSYFRNNVWWWRPLWDYCEEVAPDLTKNISGHTNVGDGLNDKNSVKLADILQKEIDAGRTLSYEKRYTHKIETTPDVTCDICHGTGKRDDQFVKGECNGCEGKGTRRPWSAHYPFSVENVQQFVHFLRDCGGFEIC